MNFASDWVYASTSHRVSCEAASGKLCCCLAVEQTVSCGCPLSIMHHWSARAHTHKLARTYTHTGFAADTLRVVTTAANTIHGRCGPFITRRSCYIIQPMAASGSTVSGFSGQTRAGRNCPFIIILLLPDPEEPGWISSVWPCPRPFWDFIASLVWICLYKTFYVHWQKSNAGLSFAFPVLPSLHSSVSH